MKIISGFSDAYPFHRLAGLVAQIESETDAGGWSAWLEPTGTVMLAVVLVLLCTVAWAANLVALPGNWFAVFLLALYAWLGPQESRASIGYIPVLVAFLFAMVGEMIEFFAAAAGAQRAGASKKSTFYAVIGSIGGAVLGAVIGIPVPVVGPVLAAILFGGVGAACGAMYGEWTDGRTWKENWSIGHATFWGRTFGVLGKASVGFAIVLIAFAGVLF